MTRGEAPAPARGATTGPRARGRRRVGAVHLGAGPRGRGSGSEHGKQRFIGQLTGVRFVAATWVMLYHFQVPLATLGLLVPVLHEFLRVGRLGVDLFFALSGFILTHTYLTRMGPQITWPKSRHFLWLRLARIYPVHFVMLNVAGLAVLAQAKFGSSDAGSRDWLNPVDYVKQVLLVHEWGPSPQRGWNFPAWSLSMEWLAYLLFPLLVLALFRFHERFRFVPVLALGRRPVPADVVRRLLPRRPVLHLRLGVDDPHPHGVHRRRADVPRRRAVLGGDADGPRPRVERLATTLSVALPVLIVVMAMVLGHLPSLQWTVSDLPDTPNAADLPPRYHLSLVPLLILWIGALALTSRGPSRFLSRDRLILGGYISFSLYMTHTVWYGLWRAVIKALDVTGGVLYARLRGPRRGRRPHRLADVALHRGARPRVDAQAQRRTPQTGRGGADTVPAGSRSGDRAGGSGTVGRGRDNVLHGMTVLGGGWDRSATATATGRSSDRRP